ncbi:MAG: PQQ-like beta-propeller repeat protein [Pirellulales bacterium]|nr:PQQ-like beta-propeller repeat protein [Pirellulales bacterium]
MDKKLARPKIWQFSLFSMLVITFIAALITPEVVDHLVQRQYEASRVVPTHWDLASGKNVLWRTELGSCVFRSPVIDEEQIYIGTNNQGGFLKRYPPEIDLGVLLCLRRKDGKILWQHSNEKLPTGRVHDWPFQGVTSRPCVERDRLWYLTNRCEVVCLDTQGFHDDENDGPYRDEGFTNKKEADVVWRLDLMGELGVRPHNVSTSCVALWKDRIFVVTGNGVDGAHTESNSEAPSFLALDKTTGKVLWSDNSPGKNILHGQWGSPAVGKLGGTTQVIFPGGDGWLYSFDPLGTSDGKSKLLWKFDCNPKDSLWVLGGRGTRNNLMLGPTIDEGLVYIATGQDPEHGSGVGRVWCIDPTKRGDVSPELVFNKRDPKTPVPHRRLQACVADQGDYTVANPHSAAVWQFEAEDVNGDGEIEFVERMYRSLSSIEIKDDLLFVSDTEGALHCLDRATGKQHWGYDMFANCYASPLIAGKHVYLGDADGEIAVFGLSADPKIAMPGGKPIAEMTCDRAIYGTMNVKDNVMYIVTQNEMIAVGEIDKQQ